MSLRSLKVFSQLISHFVVNPSASANNTRARLSNAPLSLAPRRPGAPPMSHSLFRSSALVAGVIAWVSFSPCGWLIVIRCAQGKTQTNKLPIPRGECIDQCVIICSQGENFSLVCDCWPELRFVLLRSPRSHEPHQNSSTERAARHTRPYSSFSLGTEPPVWSRTLSLVKAKSKLHWNVFRYFYCTI